MNSEDPVASNIQTADDNASESEFLEKDLKLGRK